MTPSPDLPKPAASPTLHHASPWSPARLSPGRRRAATLVASLAVLLLAVWTVPPLLDWGRFRGTIASIAAARLGRPVRIGGEVTLRLLPRAVLTAADVTLPDQGDGISATIASLRLEVAIVPLLAGHLAPRDLVLGGPVLRLPWPLPEKLAIPGRPRVPRAFAAHLDNGTLFVGGARVQGIDAALHSGPDTQAGFGATPAEPGAQGFGAEGFAAFAGRRWRFTSALGAPDADGVSAVDLSVRGQGRAAGTDAKVQGTLADGVLQGRLVAGGPDLSLLLPQAALAWRAEAPFVADGARITAPSISLVLGGSPAEGALRLLLTRPARLEGRLHVASIDLDGWARSLPARVAVMRAAVPELTGQIDLSADQASLLGGTLTSLRGTLALDGAALSLRQGNAVLPGSARLTLAGTISGDADGVRISGPMTLDAPALRTTLSWLRPIAPALVDAVPAGTLAQAKFAGQGTIGPASLSISGLSGEIDGQEVSGDVRASLGPHPVLGVRIGVSRLVLDPWLDPLWPPQAPSLVRLGRTATGLATDIHLHAPAASWHGRELHDFVLDGQTGQGGLALHDLRFATSDALVEARGGVAADGTVIDGGLRIAAHGPNGLSALMPPFWAWAAPVWRGDATLNATLSGPARDLAVQLRADAGDLVLEADGSADPEGRTAAGSVTLRHPGAPRLLAALGMARADQWLGTGSLAVRAQVAVTPERVTIDGFDLRAAELGLSGRLTLDRTQPDPSWAGTIEASTLALPAPSHAGETWPDAARGVTADVGLSAQSVTIDGRECASDMSAQLRLAHGAGLIEIARAAVLGGAASGQVAFDARARTALAVRGSLSGAAAADLLPAQPVGPSAGKADIWADLAGDAAPGWPASLSGVMSARLQDITLNGFDLDRAGLALSQRGKAARSALQSALSKGATPGLSGSISANLAHGAARLGPSRLAGEAGDVDVSGSADLAARSLDLVFGLAPGGTTSGIGVRITGPWSDPHAQPLIQPARRIKPRGT